MWKNSGDSITWKDEAIPDDPSKWNPTKEPLDNSPINLNIEWDTNPDNVHYD